MGLELIVIVSLIALAGAQLVPENSCPDYFRYVNDAFQGVQGEITLPSLMRGRNRIDIRFSQRGEQDVWAGQQSSRWFDNPSDHFVPSHFVGLRRGFPDPVSGWKCGTTAYRIGQISNSRQTKFKQRIAQTNASLLQRTDLVLGQRMWVACVRF